MTAARLTSGPIQTTCGEDYTAEAVESDHAFVVIVTRHPHVGLVPK